jgi:hypothetical protein
VGLCLVIGVALSFLCPSLENLVSIQDGHFVIYTTGKWQ